MATKSPAKPSPEAKAEPEAKPETSKVRATDVLEDVFKAIDKAGPEGIGLKALGEATGLRYRVLHNVTWRLEVKDERIHRVGEERKVLYAAVEAKPARKLRAPGKPAAKVTTAKATKAA
jgi:hypothetical protein